MDKLEKFNIKQKISALAKHGVEDHYDASQAELNVVKDKVNEIMKEEQPKAKTKKIVTEN